jgi:hypothetical protein
MKPIFPKGAITALLSFVLLLFFSPAQSQQIGKPGGNLLNFANTGLFGGQLAHIQAGAFGNFGATNRWIGIGQPSFPFTGPIPVYGMRIQDRGQAGTFSLNEAPDGWKDLEIQWGPEEKSKFRLNFIKNPNDPTALRNVMTASSDGRVGINRENLPNNRLTVISEAGDNDAFTISAENQKNFSEGCRFAADFIASRSQSIISNSSFFTIGALGSGSTSGGTAFGTYGTGSSSSASYGAYGSANSSGGSNSVAYGVYGTATSSSGTAFAGYFAGDVTITGGISSGSDRRLKENIAQETNAMNRILQLSPSVYEFRQDAEAGRMNMPDGLQHGFIAQELEKVFPELVGEAVHTFAPSLGEINKFSENNQPKIEQFRYKTVNYMGIIPILTAGLQEQYAQVEAQAEQIADYESRIAELEDRLLALEAGNGVDPIGKGQVPGDILLNQSPDVLYQNVPNPFNAKTEIRYTLNRKFNQASLHVYDMNGRQLRVYNDLPKGEDAVIIQGNELEPGMYIYALIADGLEIGTKRMILTQ